MRARGFITLGLIIGICLKGITALQAQDVVVKSGFFLDSLRVGDETGFYLSATYPSHLNVIFPDSTFDYSPFEFQYRRYFTTSTSNGKSYDSVIYYLSTFEVDDVQTLSLPVFQLNPLDSIAYRSNVDTILLASLAKDIPDTLTAQNLPLRENTLYEDVPHPFNYPILIIGLAILLVIAAIVWIGFGKKIRRYFKLKKLSQAHNKFIETYSRQVETVKAEFSPLYAEQALVHWKKYMEQLEAKPYTKLTTRETTRLENNEALGHPLHSIDGAIYGHNTSVVEPLENLKQVADQRFARKLEEVKHG